MSDEILGDYPFGDIRVVHGLGTFFKYFVDSFFPSHIFLWVSLFLNCR